MPNALYAASYEFFIRFSVSASIRSVSANTFETGLDFGLSSVIVAIESLFELD